MKYLQLFEAFESSFISNTIKFIKNKVDKKESDKFLKDLKDLIAIFDLPIDKISDKYVKYLKSKKALELKYTEEVNNNKGVGIIKYWFSLSDGYLGYTGTGDELVKFEKDKISGENEKFTNRELDYIKTNSFGNKKFPIINGEIYPVSNYSDLKTGDEIILFCGNDNDLDILTKATIYKEPNEVHLYAVQNISDGGTPNGGGNWGDFGRYTWSLNDTHGPSSDHSKLHFYKETSEPLHYIEIEEKEETSENPLEWNLPIGRSGRIEKWKVRYNYNSIDNYKKLDDADFCIVFYIDELLGTILTDDMMVSDLKRERGIEKLGSTKLISDETIRKMNMERYIQKLSNKLKISTTDFFDLEKIMLKFLMSEMSLISLYNGSPSIYSIENVIYKLYNIADDTNENNQKSNLLRFIDSYKDLNLSYYKYLQIYRDNINLINKMESTNFKNTFNKIIELGTQIYKWVKSQSINTIDDFLIIYNKIKSIRNFLSEDRNLLSYSVREINDGFAYTDISRYINYINDYNLESMNSDIKKLDLIGRFIKSTLN